MEMTINIILIFLIFIFSTFFYWNALKEDYIPAQIFSSINIFLLSIAITTIGIASYDIFVDYTAFFYLASFLFVLFYSKKRGMKSFEIYEAFAPAVFFIIGGIYLKNSIIKNNWYDFAGLLILIISASVYVYFHKNYKRLSWYSTGRIGISASLSIFVMSLLLFILELMSLGKSIFSQNVVDLFLFLFIMISNAIVILWLRNKK